MPTPHNAPHASSATTAAATAAAAYAINGQPATPQQFYALACHTQHHVLVEACAGAGKTWMLVSRIVRALLAGAAPEQILAITFTRKASAEMLQRLQEWLADFARMPLPDLAKIVRKNILRESNNALPNGLIVLKGGNLSDELKPFAKLVEVTPISTFFKEEWFDDKQVVYLPM